MFKIRSADQKEYGPVNADSIRQWIAQRRVDARTLIQAEGAGDWKPASEFAEFKDVLAASAASVPPPPFPIVAPASPAKTSAMAVTSLVLGILGCTALVGLVLGVISLIKINRSGGRLKGAGLAIAGICVSGIMLVMSIPVGAALLIPALVKAKSKAQTVSCVNNLKQLALGVRLYANDNNDQYPPGATWCDAILPQVGSPKPFQCNLNPDQRGAYAFNQKLVGKKETEVDPNTVMLFEFDGGWNAIGGPELLPSRSPHGKVVAVAFADGSVRQVQVSEIAALRWDP